MYGSRARGTARPTSDFDIGIWGENPLPLVAFYQLGDMLEALPTLYKIDLVDLKEPVKNFSNMHSRERGATHMNDSAILEDYAKSLRRLETALAEPANTDLVKAGCIQYFEFVLN